MCVLCLFVCGGKHSSREGRIYDGNFVWKCVYVCAVIVFAWFEVW